MISTPASPNARPMRLSALGKVILRPSPRYKPKLGSDLRLCLLTMQRKSSPGEADAWD
jgi:hypothetical protein